MRAAIVLLLAGCANAPATDAELDADVTCAADWSSDGDYASCDAPCESMAGLWTDKVCRIDIVERNVPITIGCPDDRFIEWGGRRGCCIGRDEGALVVRFIECE
jgi:hypothetical protein